jgi:hypothetical protein
VYGLKDHGATVSLLGKYWTFTIVKRGNRFCTDGRQCQADDV